MTDGDLNQWPGGYGQDDFGVYRPRRMGALGLWTEDEWALKAYAIQSREAPGRAPIISAGLEAAAREHTIDTLTLTHDEGAYYKTGFVVVHAGRQANWLLFQWWTHQDVWCQFLSYAEKERPEEFVRSEGPVRACVYETAIIWFEQKSWIAHVLSGAPDRAAYLRDMMQDEYC